MARLIFSESELFADPPGLAAHRCAGHLLHGGLDDKGAYVSPRTLQRWPAVLAWQESLKQRGYPLIDASSRLLQRDAYPNYRQQKWLLQQGLGETLWNSLTVTGVVEARGRMLAQMVPPDFQAIIEEDVSGTTVGHLAKGLLKAHGWDEGGVPESGLGGHDTMWFALRDLLFGAGAFPMPEVPPSLARPQTGRVFPMIPEAYEPIMLMLMNVLMIEIRAEAFFSFCVKVMRDPELFPDRRDAANDAAVMVERIREDEAIHVAYLQTAVSELRSFHFKLENGQTLLGSSFIDPIWKGFVHWHSVTTLDHSQEQTKQAIEARLGTFADSQAKITHFHSLA